MCGRLLLPCVVAIAIVSSSVAWAQGAAGRAVATFDGTGANAWAGNIRVSDEDLVSLLDEGMKKSPTFRALADRLSKSDVIVYVRTDVTARGNAPTRLAFLTSAGNYRYLTIRVPPGQPRLQQIAMLGHQLQHVVAIADAPSVVDSQSLKREFERIGRVSQVIGDDFSFDSPAATEAKRRILSEIVSEGKPAPKLASAKE